MSVSRQEIPDRARSLRMESAPTGSEGLSLAEIHYCVHRLYIIRKQFRVNPLLAPRPSQGYIRVVTQPRPTGRRSIVFSRLDGFLLGKRLVVAPRFLDFSAADLKSLSEIFGRNDRSRPLEISRRGERVHA